MRARILIKLEDGRLEATASDFPSFLYEDASPSIKKPNPAKVPYNDEDIEVGLLQGYYLVRVRFFFQRCIHSLITTTQIFQHLYCCPSVASKSAINDKNPPNPTKGAGPGNAKLHGMRRVTPGAIAYAAVQVRRLMLLVIVIC